MSDSSEAIIERMRQIRSRRSERIADISSEAERLTDWKEYVRSAPWAVFITSITVGALGSKALLGGQTNAAGPSSARGREVPRMSAGFHADAPGKSVIPKLLSTIVSLAMPIVINTARSQISRTISNFQHDGVQPYGK